MARKARIKSEFGIFHITQQGGNCRNLFTNDDERSKLVDIINRSKKKFGFILHGFCLISDNSYDLIIDVNGGDLSKIMKSINIAYAMYAKCEGKLFTDRYKSKPLNTQEELDTLKSRLRQRKATLSPESCFNICVDTFDFVNLENTLLDINFEDCNGCLTCMENALTKLQEFAKVNGITINELKSDKNLRNQLIKIFRQHSTLSLKSLGELFGGLSESSVSKIINS